MRRGEAMNLKWDEVGTAVITIVSTAGARTKSGRWRQVPLSQGARRAIQSLKNETPYVLTRIHRVSLSRAFSVCAARAKLPGSLHSLRHTFCSHLAMRGIPLRTIQRLAGHATFITTERYAHLSPSHLERAVSGLHL